MQIRNTATAWGVVSKTIHWVVAICIFTAMITAILNNQLQADDPWQRRFATWLMDVHRSCGMTALILGLLRLLWVILPRRPDLPAGMSAWDMKASRRSHMTIYALAVLVPTTGYLTTVTFGTRVEWFWLFHWPSLVAQNRDLVPYVYHAHWILYHMLLVIVVLHVGAALWHHYSKQDGVLLRMLPFGKPERQTRDGA